MHKYWAEAMWYTAYKNTNNSCVKDVLLKNGKSSSIDHLISVRSTLQISLSGSVLRIKVDSWKRISGLPHLCFSLNCYLKHWMRWWWKSSQTVYWQKGLIIKCCSSVAEAHSALPQPFANTPKHVEDGACAEVSWNTVEESAVLEHAHHSWYSSRSCSI